MQPEKDGTAFIVFVRYPAPGKVKTRLAKALGEEKAAAFYRACAEKVFEECRIAGAETYIFYSDQRDAAAVKEWTGPGFLFATQRGVSLGERLENALGEVLEAGAKRALVMASDTPDLSAGLLRRAAEGLARYNIVIGPACDGGYYLLGMKKLHAGLFRGIAWSTGKVQEQTLAAAGRLGLTALVLPELRDIDTAEDLELWLKTARTANPAAEALRHKE
jgi:rSAM/selenodomain-associated transferase 1